MTEQEVWEEIGKLEQAMKQMHDGLDRIIAGCSNPDARAIRYEADAMKRRISSAFEGKFALVEATSNIHAIGKEITMMQEEINAMSSNITLLKTQVFQDEETKLWTGKFRAWHKQERKMYPVVGTFYNLVFLSSSWDAVNVSQDVVTVINIDAVYMMQFTGIKDRNGKEIYQGDIVMWNIYPEDKDTVTVFDVVECTPGLFATKARHQILATIEPHRKLEVIGNIYDHPELIAQ